MTSIRIRPATPADVSFILAMVKELAVHEDALHEVETTEAMMHEALFGDRPACEGVIGEFLGAQQGIALFFHTFSSWTGVRGLYLEDLYVRPEARGAGLGAALLRHVAGVAVSRGCPRLEWIVLDSNDIAVEFYRRLGARAMTDWTIHRVSGERLRGLVPEK